jgi:hypothetical protein
MQLPTGADMISAFSASLILHFGPRELLYSPTVAFGIDTKAAARCMFPKPDGADSSSGFISSRGTWPATEKSGASFEAKDGRFCAFGNASLVTGIGQT